MTITQLTFELETKFKWFLKNSIISFFILQPKLQIRSLACINHSQQRVKLKEKAQLLTIWTLIGYTCVWFLSCKVTCCMIHVKICWILCSIVFVFSFLTHEHLWVSYNLLQVNCNVLLHVFLGRFGRASRLQNLKRLEKYTKTHWAKLWREWWPQNLFLFLKRCSTVNLFF